MVRAIRPWLAACAGALAAVAITVVGAPATAAEGGCVEGVIETIAGDGRCCFWGDGGPATEASLWHPEGVAVGADGTLYIADTENNRVRKVSPAGTITTIAGIGTCGGPPEAVAIYSMICTPMGLAIGADGSLYVAADLYVLKVEPTGGLTVVAGGERIGFAGDGGPATEATLSGCYDVALAPDGTLYLSDTRNHRIRKVNPAGTITTVAGNGNEEYSGDGGPATEAGLNHPRSIALAPDGSLYIADTGNHRIRRLDPAGVITTVAGDGWRAEESGEGRFAGDGGPAIKASLHYPEDVAVGDDGSLYIADMGSHRIRKVDVAGVITTVVGDGWEDPKSHLGRFAGDGGPALAASLEWPWGVAVGADGSLYIADRKSNRIRRVDPAGIITTVAGDRQQPFYGDGGPATHAGLYRPKGVAVAADGAIYIADRDNHRVRKIDAAGIITTIAGTNPWQDLGDGGPAAAASLYYPSDVALAPDGSLLIADNYHHRIRRIQALDGRVDAAGIITTIAGNGERGYGGDGEPATEAQLDSPEGVAAAPDGSVYIADTGNNRIRKVDLAGVITTFAGTGETGLTDGGPALQTMFNMPNGVAVGPDGSVYIADGMNRRIRKVDPAGEISIVAGEGHNGYAGEGGPATDAHLGIPYDLTVGRDGSLYIAVDNVDHILRVDAQGIITSVAGNGSWGYWGDGGLATEASIWYPCDVALGPDGSLYIADGGSNRIRRIRWRPCDPEAAKMSADELRATAGDSAAAWREVGELYLNAQAWDEALAAAQQLSALAAEGEEATRQRAEILAARAYAGKRDDHEARRRLIPILGRAADSVVVRDAAAALVDLYLMRHEREVAVATLNDLRARTRDRLLREWIDRRLAELADE